MINLINIEKNEISNFKKLANEHGLLIKISDKAKNIYGDYINGLYSVLYNKEDKEKAKKVAEIWQNTPYILKSKPKSKKITTSIKNENLMFNKTQNKINRLIKEADELNNQKNNQPPQLDQSMVDDQPGVANKREAISYIEETAQSFKELYDRLKIIKTKIYGNTQMRQSESNDQIDVITKEFENLYREFNQIALKSKSMA